MSEDAGRQAHAGSGGTALAPELLEILRCPSCLGQFAPPDPAVLVCTSCGLRYPVRNGVPILLVDEAQPPRDGEAARPAAAAAPDENLTRPPTTG